MSEDSVTIQFTPRELALVRAGLIVLRVGLTTDLPTGWLDALMPASGGIVWSPGEVQELIVDLEGGMP